MASLGLRITLRFSFEIRRCDVIEQEIILSVEERRVPLFEVLLNIVLVFEQMVMGAIKAIRVHPIRRHAHQVIKRRSLIPGVGNM